MNRIQTVIVTALLAGAVPLAVHGNILNHRINELETYYTIYASRFENWSNRALQDEQIIENLQQVNTTAQQQPAPESDLPAGMVAEYAGEYTCTAYCTEKRPHICGTGTGITASGAPITADLTVAADQSLLPFGTVIYIEGVGVRVVQDKGSGVQGKHLDVAVPGSHSDALNWAGYGTHKVWILKGDASNDEG